MNTIYSEFEIRDDMKHDEFEHRKQHAIDDVIQRYINQIKTIENEYEPNIFNKNIAYKIHEERYRVGDAMFERIVLEPIAIQTIEYNPSHELFLEPKKYSFKDRIKILFTGRK